MDLENLNVQPVTAFEVKGAFLVTLFPSIFQGFVSVLCGKEVGLDRVKVIHDCSLCNAYGHKYCPYVKSGIKSYMIYKRQKYTAYSIQQKEIIPNANWTQIPVPSIKVDEKKESEGHEQQSIA